MQRNYQLAAAALAASAVLLAASGAVAFTDSSQAERPASTPSTPHESTPAETGAGDSIPERNESSLGCDGFLSVDPPEYIRSDVQVGDVTVTVNEYPDGEPFANISKERFAELVWENVSQRAQFAGDNHIELRVRHLDDLDVASTDRNQFTVRPMEKCLPTVEGEVNTTDRTLSVETVYSDYGTVDLDWSNHSTVLTDEQRAMVTGLLRSTGHARYNIHRQFGDPVTLVATARYEDENSTTEVNVELRRPGRYDKAIVLSVDLEDERITQSSGWEKADPDGTVTERDDGAIVIEETDDE